MVKRPNIWQTEGNETAIANIPGHDKPNRNGERRQGIKAPIVDAIEPMNAEHE